jgi:hypothetical protein
MKIEAKDFLVIRAGREGKAEELADEGEAVLRLE